MLAGEVSLMTTPPAGGVAVPPDVIYIIRHGEKPADPPAAGPGQPPPAPAAPFGVNYQGNQDPHSLLPEGLATLRCACRPLRPGTRDAASGTANPRSLALTLLRGSSQDGCAPDVSDDPGPQRPAGSADRLGLRRGPGSPAGHQRGERLPRRRADLLGARPHPGACLVAADHPGNSRSPRRGQTTVSMSSGRSRSSRRATPAQYTFGQIPQQLLSGDTDTVIPAA